MKKVSRLLGRMEASLNGSLDGLQLDNTSDVIEKSLVIEMVNDLKMLVNEAQTEVNNFSSNAPVIKSLPADDEMKRKIEIHIETTEECIENFGIPNYVKELLEQDIELYKEILERYTKAGNVL